MTESSQQLLSVPSLLWFDHGHLFKVPFHTFGSIKKRHLRLKQACGSICTDSIEVELISNDLTINEETIVRASSPLALIWSDPKENSNESQISSRRNHSALFSLPFNKRVREENEILLQDIVNIVSGISTVAFQAFIAKNGRNCVPDASCCFSIISSKRSVDFFVSSGGDDSQIRDSEMAYAWIWSLKSMLKSFKKYECFQIESFRASINTIKQKDNKIQCAELFDAAKRGDLEKLRYHFDHGCPVDFIDEATGDTVLMHACRLGLNDVARFVLHQYHARNDPHPDFGQTALQVAVSSGHTKIVKLLLETAEPSGSDRVISNHEDGNGEAPIHIAARCGSVRIIKLLVKHGANLGLVDGRGKTCLHCAAQSGQVSCLNCLLHSGAKQYLEVKDEIGFTPLHLAVCFQNTECVEILLRAGADTTTTAGDGSNAYELAAKQKSQGIMKLFLEYDIHSIDKRIDSYDDFDGESSLNDDQMFSGLNTYTVTPASKVMIPNPIIERPATPSTYFSASEGHMSTPGIIQSPLPQIYSFYGDTFHQTFNRTSQQGSYFQTQPYFHTCDFSSSPMKSIESYMQTGFRFNYNGEAWTIFYTNEGYPYFFNINKKISSWEDPRDDTVCLEQQQFEIDSQNQTTSISTSLLPLGNDASKDGEMNVTLHTYSKKPTVNNTCKYEHNNSDRMRLNSSTLNQALSTVTVKRDFQDQSHESILTEKEAMHMTIDSSEIIRSGASLAAIKTPDSKVEICTGRFAPFNSTESTNEYRTILKEPDKINLRPNEGLAGDEAAPLSDTDEIIAAKYRMMLKMGVPPEAVKHKAIRDGIHSKVIETVVSSLKIVPAKSAVTAESSTAKDSHIVSKHTPTKTREAKKSNASNDTSVDDQLAYQHLTGTSSPQETCHHNIKRSDIEDAKRNLFKNSHSFSISKNEPPESPSHTGVAQDSQQEGASKKEDLLSDKVLSKYVQMTKVGVPLLAVASKMLQDGVDKEKISLFHSAFGLNSNSSGTSKFPQPPPRLERRRASKALQKIHWNTVAEERLKNSIWASKLNDESEIDATDIEKLESLFASSQSNQTSKTEKKEVIESDVRKKATLIDLKRGNNIAISLAQFRAFSSYDGLIQAVVTLDSENLNVEKLQSLQLLLPTKDELSRLSLYNGDTDTLGRAEQFFIAVMKVPRFAQKLSTFKFFLQFEEQATTLITNLEVLAKACDEIIGSKKLAGILIRFLAIGNVMNESVGKPAANGITLDSLIKTAKMKGSDGKTTVLDSVIISKLDIVDFWTDMPTLKDASKMDLGEFMSVIKELESGTRSVELAIQAEKSNSESIKDDLMLESSEKYRRKLEPFHHHATHKIKDINAVFRRVEGKVQALCSFFAEDVETCKASIIFGVLLEFSQLVSTSSQQLKRRESLHNRRESLRTPVKRECSRSKQIEIVHSFS